MTKDQLIAMDRFLAIEKLCGENYQLWKEHYGFRTAFHLFSGRLQQVRSQIKKLENMHPIRVENREKYRAQLEDYVCSVSSSFLVYALTHDLYDLIDELDFNRQDIRALPCEKLMSKAKDVLDMAVAHAKEIKAYDVSLVTLGELDQTIEYLDQCVHYPEITGDVTREIQKKLEEELDDLFHQTKMVLRDHLDQQIIAFKWSDRVFYDLYMDLRGNKPITSIPLQGSVVDDATHLPVGNADITIPELNISWHITPLGHFIFYNLPPGKYHACVHKFGYEDRMIEVSVPYKEGDNLDIEMHHI